MLRKDGKHVLFKDYFGPTVLQPPQSDTLIPEVKLLKTNIYLNPDLDYSQKLNALLYNKDFQEFIAGVAKIQMGKGHSVLIPSERVEFLKGIKELLGDDCAIVTGETRFDERQQILEDIEKRKVLCVVGSRNIWTEGISANRLSCLIFTSPTSNEVILEQLIGRIQRQATGKPKPVVIDVNYSSPKERGQLKRRIEFYASHGWEVY
jgi:superfamily II DNA or RNA helicase